MRQTWWGAPLDEEKAAVLALVDDLVGGGLTRVGDDRPDAVDRARRRLAEHGLWTVGAVEDSGGGGADLPTTLVVLARLAGTWPALAWAAAQAHAAALILEAAGAPGAAALIELHQGAAVAVVDTTGGAEPAVHRTGRRIVGSVSRLDPAGTDPYLVLLDEGTAAVLTPVQVTVGPPLRRTGLDGALTVAARIDTEPAALVEGHAVDAARMMLQVGAVAVAAGIAQATAQAARRYSAERVQFGAPLTELPTVRSALLHQASGARALSAMLSQASLEDRVAAAAGLVHACDLAIDVAASAVQSHGGYGYMQEYLVEGLLRDAVSLRAAAGAVEVARVAARHVVGGEA